MFCGEMAGEARWSDWFGLVESYCFTSSERKLGFLEFVSSEGRSFGLSMGLLDIWMESLANSVNEILRASHG